MSTPFLKGQNLLANSRLTFWQRGISYLNADNGYQADRFRYSAAVQADYTRNTDVPTTQADYSINMSRTTSVAITGGNYCRLHQPIEGNIFRQIRGGKFTLFFWAKSSKIGPRYVYLRNSAFSRYFLQKYEITVSDTWQSFQFQITHDETGSWLYDTGVGMDVSWITQAGPTANLGTVGSWQNGAFVAGSDQVNTFDANNSYFRLALPILVPGYVILDPLNLPLARYDIDFAVCRRYFEKSYAVGVSPGTVTSAGKFSVGSVSANRPYLSIPFKTEKRVIPSVSVYNPATGALGNMRNEAGTDSGAGIDAGNIGTNQFDVFQTSNFNAQGAYGHWVADAEL